MGSVNSIGFHKGEEFLDDLTEGLSSMGLALSDGN
jgi:hypothetical protein